MRIKKKKKPKRPAAAAPALKTVKAPDISECLASIQKLAKAQELICCCGEKGCHIGPMVLVSTN